MTKYLQEREDHLFGRQREISDRLGLGNPLVFDIGANVGQSVANYRSLFPNCHVHAFEPNPVAFAQLRQAWGKDDGVELHQLALTDLSGEFPFHSTRISEVGSLLKPADRLMRLSSEHKYDYELVQVHCDTFDAHCQRTGVTHVDIVKVDVQGAEALVLAGAERALASHMVSMFYVEITLAETYDRQSELIDILTPLSQHGYKLWDIMPFLYTTPGRLWAANALFLSPEAVAVLELNLC